MRTKEEAATRRAMKQKEYNAKSRIKNREVIRERGRLYYAANKDKRKQTNKDSLLKPTIRMNNLLLGCRRRAERKGLAYNLDREFVEGLWKDSKGTCAVTGLALDLTSGGVKKNNPLAPSLDKIDCDGGYTKDNVQLVCFMYNTAKGSWGHVAVLTLARSLADDATNG